MIQKVYVVHHSHTDIGYTHGQSRIVRWHGAFIQQAMEIAKRRSDFKWTCETAYPVEEFWKRANPEEQTQFRELVKQGKIGLTAGWIHFTELGDAELMQSLADRSQSVVKEITGAPTRAAMLADVNGCPLVHARALARSGVKLLLTCVHPHHGYVPLHKRQELFNWDLGDGQTLRVLLSDHYHTGNELGFAPGGETNYTAGFSDDPAAFDETVLDRRLPAYLNRTAESGWKHDFLVLAVSGLNTDNAPPSEQIAERIARWNAKHPEVKIEMVTPEELVAKTELKNLPTHKGDFPDWWADGIAGDAEAVALFRHAQRERRWLAQVGGVDLSELDKQLGLFAEHTFGHSASVRRPWNLLAQQLRLSKLGYAGAAADLAEKLVDEASEKLGGGALAFDRPMKFLVTNPAKHRVTELVEMESEWPDAQRWGGLKQTRILANGKSVPQQILDSMRGSKWVVELSLNPGEKVELSIENDRTASAERIRVPDKTQDLSIWTNWESSRALATDHVSITLEEGKGIASWVDRKTGKNLIDPKSPHSPFAIVASRLLAPMDGNAQCEGRRILGRNRNSAQARWNESRCVNITPGQTGAHIRRVTLDYQMEGFEKLAVILEAHVNHPRVDVEVVAHKIGTWDAENVYLALPFFAGENQHVWLDRGEPIEPGVDQFPGSLCDFYGVQDGLGWTSSNFGVAVAQKDSHLIQTGPLKHWSRPLSDGKPLTHPIYAWLMTNYWETNFSPELGGFYSFRYSVIWGEQLKDRKAGLEICRDATMGLKAIRLAK